MMHNAYTMIIKVHGMSVFPFDSVFDLDLSFTVTMPFCTPFHRLSILKLLQNQILKI